MSDNKKVVDFYLQSTVVSNVQNIKNSLDKIGMGGMLEDSLKALQALKDNKDKFIADNK